MIRQIKDKSLQSSLWFPKLCASFCWPTSFLKKRLTFFFSIVKRLLLDRISQGYFIRECLEFFHSLCLSRTPATATPVKLPSIAQPCQVSTEEPTCFMWSTVPAVERGSQLHLISVYSAAPQPLKPHKRRNTVCVCNWCLCGQRLLRFSRVDHRSPTCLVSLIFSHTDICKVIVNHMEIWRSNIKYIIDRFSLKCNSFWFMQVVAWLRAEHQSSFAFIYHNSLLKASQKERP